MIDSCYLCELSREGLLVPLDERNVLICHKCVLECIWMHPRLRSHSKKKREAA